MGLIIDLFCGAGGASEGIREAMGRPVDIAVDINKTALAIHEINHPETKHVLGDLAGIDPLAMAKPGKVDLLWGSPPCVSFSIARGAKPVNPAVAALPWIVVNWAEALRPRLVIVENVERMSLWGDVESGRFKPETKGLQFKRWLAALGTLGYQCAWNVINACDFGVATIRRRLYMIAGLEAPAWPARTHGPGRQPFKTLQEHLDWGLPLTRPEDRAKPLSKFTMARIKAGINRYKGISTPPELGGMLPLVVPYHKTGIPRPVSVPITTITTRLGHGLAVCDGPRLAGYRMLGMSELKRAQGFPAGYSFGIEKGIAATAGQSGLGNSVCPPVAKALVSANMKEDV